MINDFSFLLTLRGRPRFTARLLAFLAETMPKSSIIMTDSSEVAERKTHREIIGAYEKHLQITYTEFEPENNLTEFSLKVLEGLKLVKTKYVQLLDNDDFPILSGIKNSISALQENEVIVCARGRTAGVKLQAPDQSFTDCIGRPIEVRPLYARSYAPTAIFEDTSWERIEAAYLDRYYVSYYGVYRTEHLIEIFDDSLTVQHQGLGPSHEHVLAVLALAKGKHVTLSGTVSLIRQMSTSLRSSKIAPLDLPGIKNDMEKVRLLVMKSSGDVESKYAGVFRKKLDLAISAHVETYLTQTFNTQQLAKSSPRTLSTVPAEKFIEWLQYPSGARLAGDLESELSRLYFWITHYGHGAHRL